MKAFLKNISAQLQEDESALRISSARRVTSLIPRVFLRPGRLVAFNYLGRDYTVYVIGTKRAPTGLYFSSRRNLLVTCLAVDLTQVSTQLTLSTIYKRRKQRSNYLKLIDKASQLEDRVSDYFRDLAKDQKQEINFNLFGKENFRTFKVRVIRNLTQLGIKINESDKDLS